MFIHSNISGMELKENNLNQPKYIARYIKGKVENKEAISRRLASLPSPAAYVVAMAVRMISGRNPASSREFQVPTQHAEIIM